MKSIIELITGAIAILMLGIMVSCSENSLTPAPPTPGDTDTIPSFDDPGGLYTHELKDNIDEAFAGNVVGYGYAVYRDGDLILAGGGGDARRQGPLGPRIPYLGSTVGTIFSTSKTITAAAVVDQLSELGYDLDMSIKDYLPEGWRLHETHEDITFRMLLAHTSGLLGTSDHYTEMKEAMLEENIGEKDSWKYANINYTLFRVIIPYLFWDVELDYADQQGDDVALDFCAEKYENFVRSRFAKVPVPGYQLTDTYYPDILHPTLYYDYQAVAGGTIGVQGQGVYMFDCHDISGAGGWFMSPIQYASFIDGLFNEKIVDAAGLKEMKDSQLGMYRYNGGKYGTYYTHNGGANIVPHPQGGECQWMYFPEQNVSLFVAWNSLKNNLPDSAAERNALFASIFEEAFHE